MNHTGRQAVGVSTLILNISGMAEAIKEPFEILKVETGRICLVYCLQQKSA